MENNVMEEYVEFICNEIPTTVNVLIDVPNSVRKEVYISKIGPKLWCTTNIEILEKYTRSAKFKLKFDKYEVEDIFFISRHKGPDKLLDEILSKVDKLVNKAFISDGRESEIEQKYKESREQLNKLFTNIKFKDESIN
jgi:hypothetical protein